MRMPLRDTRRRDHLSHVEEIPEPSQFNLLQRFELVHGWLVSWRNGRSW